MNFFLKNTLLTIVMFGSSCLMYGMKRAANEQIGGPIKYRRSGASHSLESSVKTFEKCKITIPEDVWHLTKPFLIKDKKGCHEGVIWTKGRPQDGTIYCSLDPELWATGAGSYPLVTSHHAKGKAETILNGLKAGSPIQNVSNDSYNNSMITYKPNIQPLTPSKEQEIARKSVITIVQNNGDLQFAAELIECYPSIINDWNSEGNTILMFAVQKYNAEMVNFFITKGALPAIPCAQGTPLSWIVKNGKSNDPHITAKMIAIIGAKASLRTITQSLNEAKFVWAGLSGVEARQYINEVIDPLVKLQESKNKDRKDSNRYLYGLVKRRLYSKK